MNRKSRPLPSPLQAQRKLLITRRRFLLDLAGGSLALLFPLSAPRAAETDSWAVLDATLNHLLPSEPDSPGATEIHALDYFRFVIDDTTQDADEREFLLRGTVWLDDLAREREGQSFTLLDATARERLLRQIERSEAGQNWLSSVLLYLIEALLTDPIYGGNFQQRGWTWLQHVPGFPRPPANKTYPKLLQL